MTGTRTAPAEGPLWLVGAGKMGIAYARVLAAMGVPVCVIGRGARSAAECERQTGLPVETGGLTAWLDRSADTPGRAIVAVDVEELAATTLALIRRGVPRLLVEKPVGVDAEEIADVAAAAGARRAQVFVGYNRRFYASVLRALEIIREDDGVTSFTFEFTERSDAVAASSHTARVKANWFLANSTHVVDLAFFLGGRPQHLVARVSGQLPWHPAAARFAGAGETASGALFSYAADWDAPGRWGVEVMTRRRRLVLRPMEQLQIQARGTFELTSVELDDRLDREFKPGLYRQVEAFLGRGDTRNLPDIQEHLDRARREYVTMVQAGRLSLAS